MTDRSVEFRAIIREILQLGNLNSEQEVLRKPRKINYELQDFFTNANQLRSDLTQLRDYLIATRHDYINTSSAIMASESFNEYQCDEIDSKYEIALKRSRSLLDSLKAMQNHHNELVKYHNFSDQALDQERAMVMLIQAYLSAINGIHGDLKNIRKRKLINQRRLTRLSELLKSSSQPFPRYSNPIEQFELPADRQDASNAYSHELRQRRQPVTFDDSLTNPAEDENDAADDKLRQENMQLFQRFNTMTHELEKLSTRVTEIGELQTVFNEHIDRQSATVDHIYTTSVHTTEDIKYGNEQIRQAMKRKADMRVWVLFCILVLTFTLCFLHWYNP